ncbi:GIY-YIG nuclease family protein [Neptunomonas marina]|uniref:GIY-YIG nuclease family protein n=1 Tax=Neptunomonas marina TaxID=1815562 RepID=A0A437Q509_9GAMM|nr:GIY-YIG nuclease family protein [Neptunomonas marina]RVU29584.1 GIY-YIG nuclease family protein [Neptunomonas marina]
MWFVYLLECADKTLYAGITTDCERRVEEHNHDPRKGAKYTRARRPVALVWSEAQPTRAEATRRELAIKRLSRAKKLALIANLNN